MTKPVDMEPGRPPFRFSLKGLLLFLLPAPTLLAALIALGSGKLGGVLTNAGGYALFLLAAVLTRRSLLTVVQQPLRRYTRSRDLPLRNLGAGTLAAATAFTAYFAADHGLAISLAFALVAVLAFHLLYGLEPVRGPQTPVEFGVDKERVADALELAESRILAIEQASREIRNAELKQRLARIARQGRSILQLIERRPRDLRRARKFLSVYLEGAQRVTEGYAKTHKLADSSELEQNFRNVLITIEDVFRQQQQRLLETDVTDLDVQIEVLSNQLKREGLL